MSLKQGTVVSSKVFQSSQSKPPLSHSKGFQGTPRAFQCTELVCIRHPVLLQGSAATKVMQ